MDAERAAWQRLRELRREIGRDATELQIRWHEVKRSVISQCGGVLGVARELGRMIAPGPRTVRASRPPAPDASVRSARETASIR